MYSVINMDIVGSRTVEDRRQLQINLNSYIEDVNDKYRDILAAPAAITLGDEWQLITGKLSEAYNLIHEFQQLLWKDNVDLYAGIGIGELKTQISEDIRKMDGPCFHSARKALNVVKNMKRLKNKYTVNKQNKIFLLSDYMQINASNMNVLDFYYTSKLKYTRPVMQEIAAASEFTHEKENGQAVPDILMLERTINLLIENNEVLKARMTKKQKEIYVSYLKLGSYRRIVDSAGSNETIGGISQKLNSAGYFTIQRNHQLVSDLLNSYCSIGE